MKRILSYICIAMSLSLSLVSCIQESHEINGEPRPVELLALSEDSLDAEAEGATFTVTATSRYMPECRVEYSDSQTDEWITCSVGHKSSYDVPLNIVIAENKTFQDRSATISVVIRDERFGVEYAKTISVTQTAAVPRAENGEYKISADKYNISFTIKTNLINYTIYSEQSSWVTLNKSKGSGNTTITASVTTNKYQTERSTSIYIKSADAEFEVAKITQEAMVYKWSTSFDGKEYGKGNNIEINAPWYAKEFTIKIATNLSWTAGIVNGSSYIDSYTKKVDVTLQTNPTATEFKFKLKENRSADREVEFKVEAPLDKKNCTTIKITQSFAPALSINNNEDGEPLRFEAADHSVGVYTSEGVKWSAQSDADWLTIKTRDGEGSAPLEYSVSKNDGVEPRTATISVSLSDYEGVMAEYEVTQNCDNTIHYTAKSQLDIKESDDYWGDRIVRHGYDETTQKGYIEFETAPTKVGDSVFKNCGDLVGIKLPKSITSIEGYAFYSCSNLESVEMSEGFTSIGYRAFEECEKLKNITIPSSVSSIGDRAFYHCANLESINIPEGITSIGSAMFAHCTSFTTVTIPDSVTSINENAFNDCTGLTSLTIGQGVESIGAQSFLDCTGLTSITIPESVTSIGARAFGYFTGELIVNSKIVETDYTEENRRGSNNHWLDLCRFTKVTFGRNITKIGDNAFHSCTTLKNAAIPSSVISIGDYAFANCKGLEKINVPNSVTSIGKYAFEECTGRLEMNSREIIETDYNTFEYDDYIAENTYNNFWIKNCHFAEIVLGSHITKIGERAFYNCDGIGRVLFGTPYSITSIGSYSFYGCSGINYMYIHIRTRNCFI